MNGLREIGAFEAVVCLVMRTIDETMNLVSPRWEHNNHGFKLEIKDRHRVPDSSAPSDKMAFVRAPTWPEQSFVACRILRENFMGWRAIEGTIHLRHIEVFTNPICFTFEYGNPCSITAQGNGSIATRINTATQMRTKRSE